MPASFTNLLENEVLNRYFRNTTALVPVATVYLAFYSTAPDEAGAGTELSGDGYTRMPVTFAAPVGGVIANTADILFPTATPAGWTVAGAAIVDTPAGACNMLAYDAFGVAVVIPAGERANVAANALTISLD